MLSALLDKARADEALWLPDLREIFAADATARALILRLCLHDGTRRDFPCPLPRWETEEEKRFVAEYLYANVYNLLSVCSGRTLTLFFDRADGELAALCGSLDDVFQLHAPARHGYGKVINIACRIGGGDFSFETADLAAYTPLPEPAEQEPGAPLDARLRAVCEKTAGLGLCGIDVGGTDIKLAVSDGETLLAAKEFDWNPAASPTVEAILEPLLLLTRLMRACLAASRAGAPEAVRARLWEALKKDAPFDLIREAVETAEAELGPALNVLDGIGLSYPDIVIGDRILGGETPKTDGMRRNTAIDYETAFSKLTNLKDDLLSLCREGGRVRITNDGNMAAFTAAMELAHSDDAGSLRDGVIAHSLGTELGTGWLTAEGTIPALPLELYDLILDLGSYPSRAWAPEDLRCTRNENSGLPGARRYMGQAAAYRLAQKLDPRLLEGFTAEKDGVLTIRTAPRDLRKPCLEHLMRQAAAGTPAACAIFTGMGETLSVVVREMDFLLRPRARARFLFGRFVKHPQVFRLIDGGFRRGLDTVRLIPSDEELAKTPLMRALAAAPELTVAQFGQAIGSIYFAMTQ